MPQEKGSREARYRDWYNQNAAAFSEAVAIELPFLGLDPVAQQRLNRFKLWALLEDHLVEWRDRDVLEFGAGHGRFAVELPGYRSYLGIDSSANLVEIGMERLAARKLDGRARIQLGDCMEYDPPPEGFDVVCSLGMLPYVEDLSGVARKMAQCAKAGGTVLADFKHRSPLYEPARIIGSRLRPQTGGGSRFHTKAELREAMAAAGLRDVTFVMREYPFLAEWYAEKGLDWPLRARQFLCRRPWLDGLALTGFVVARKPQ
jgi:SAM-dependent methyltransferase